MSLSVVPPSPLTQLIFDWDDTICPSSFLSNCPYPNEAAMPLELRNVFDTISQTAMLVLNIAMNYGNVTIITNSDNGWVHHSCRLYLPRLLPFLEQGRVRVVSARSNYEGLYPSQPLCWKAAAFAHEVNEMWENRNGQTTTADMQIVAGSKQIISIGDSLEERTAVRIVSTQLNAVSKSIQFLQQPNPMLVLGQLHLLTEYMKSIVESEQELDLTITREQAERSAREFGGRFTQTRNEDNDRTVTVN
jgi:hypothetical protein